MNSAIFEKSRLKPLVLAGTAAVFALALSGCATTMSSITGATAVAAADAPQAKKKKTAPVQKPMPTFDAFRGDGIFFFDDNLRSQFFVSDQIATNGRWSVKEKYDRGATHGFTWGAGAATTLKKSVSQPVEAPSTISVEKTGDVILHYDGNPKKGVEPLALRVRLTAYDMSGLPIGPYLKNRSNKSTTAGWLISNRYVFPEGAVGYRASVSVDADEVLVPTQKAFTGSNSIENFSERFTKEIPYCLRYLPSKTAEPMGLRFSQPIVKKTQTIKPKKGRARTEEVAQSGEAMLYPVKKGTIFCAASGSQLASVRWDLRYVNGTRVLYFTFPKEINPSDYGMLNEHGNALRVAFAEEVVKQRGKATRQVRPAALWLAGKSILDPQWRFNAVAADAISDAIARTAGDRAKWEAEQAAK